MSSSFQSLTQPLETIYDFFRFGLSQANASKLYYGHGTDNGKDDIESLILQTLHLPFDIEPQYLHAKLTADEKKRLCQQLEKRIIERIPVPYLTHQAQFCGLNFYVDPRVLIPRSPIAELIMQQFSVWLDATKVKNILEIGTGSGCIAIACCYAFDAAQVDAVDISDDALAVAQRNLDEHQCSNLTLIKSNCFDGLSPNKRYDIIISNPPYVGAEEMAALPKEYYHEPRMALEAEENGLAIVEKILFHAHDYLNEEGILVVEVGNSEQLLVDKYPNIPFSWLDFEHGGEGVFLLTKKQLAKYFK